MADSRVMKTFREAFKGKKEDLMEYLDVTILLLGKLHDITLLRTDQFRKLVTDFETKCENKHLVSTLLDMLEKRQGRQDVDELELFCKILREVEQQQTAEILAPPVNRINTTETCAQTDEPILIRNRPLYTRVCSLMATLTTSTCICVVFVAASAIIALLVSMGTTKEQIQQTFLDIPKRLQDKLVSQSLPQVRQNNTLFIESLSHSSTTTTTTTDVVDRYPREEISAHIQRIILNARIALKDTLRNIDVHDVDSKVTVYTKFVLPIFENGSSAWNPDMQKDIEDIENFQREFVDSVLGPENKMTYRQKLENLGLESLELRRLRKILIHAYGIAFDLVHDDKDCFDLTTDKTLGGHNRRLEIRISSNAKLLHFCLTAVNTWNKLPADKVNFTNIEAFEKSLTSDVLLSFCRYKLD